MSFPNWFRRAPQQSLSPRLRSLLDKVVSYLKDNGNDDEVVPKFVAKAIDESEISVITALRFLEQAGVARQWYGIFCKTTDVPLGRFASLSEIPEEFSCEICDEQHCFVEDTCKVEILYTVDWDKLDAFDLRTSAA